MMIVPVGDEEEDEMVGLTSVLKKMSTSGEDSTPRLGKQKRN
jgi:hypothetical protein